MCAEKNDPKSVKADRDETSDQEFVSSLQDSKIAGNPDPGVSLRCTPGYSNFAPSAQRSGFDK